MLFVLWAGHIIIAAWAVVPMAVLGRRRAAWEYWEALVFLVPFGAWALLSASPMAVGTKSISNLGEPGTISLAIILGTAIRLAWGQRPYRRVLAAVLIAAITGVAMGVFFFTPLLPEP